MRSPDLLTPEELVEILRLPSRATLYRWRARGGGPPVFKIGRHLRYPRAGLERWLEGKADR